MTISKSQRIAVALIMVCISFTLYFATDSEPVEMPTKAPSREAKTSKPFMP
jgi:hypothetical protein